MKRAADLKDALRDPVSTFRQQGASQTFSEQHDDV
jgi:hypothetical protein